MKFLKSSTSQVPQGSKSRFGAILLTTIALCLFSIIGCQKDSSTTLDDMALEPGSNSDMVSSRAASTYKVENIVSDEPEEYDADAQDANLVNAWGLAISPSQQFWVTATGSNKLMAYNHDGSSPKPALNTADAPIGIVYNSTSSFKVPGTTQIARFIMATDSGAIQIWNPWQPNTVTTVVDNTGGLVGYTGIEIARSSGKDYIYLANVKGGEIDVYDKNFNYVDMDFEDPNLPAGAKPFNIRLINGKLYVTYVGPGGGFVNVFNTDGSFVKRFATGGTLAAPWGITKVPSSFGMGPAILVGNFGSGTINIYDYNGNYKGQLTGDNGQVIEIDGLWALSFTQPGMNGSADPYLYFTAGPDDEAHGVFGYIEKSE